MKLSMRFMINGKSSAMNITGGVAERALAVEIAKKLNALARVSGAETVMEVSIKR